MDDQLFNKVFKSIPNHFGELYLEPELREYIAKEVTNALNDGCDHNWSTITSVKLIDPKVCKKCGKLKNS